MTTASDIISRFAKMSPEELEQEQAKDWHDGQVDPDWRGRGASVAIDLVRIANLARMKTNDPLS